MSLALFSRRLLACSSCCRHGPPSAHTAPPAVYGSHSPHHQGARFLRKKNCPLALVPFTHIVEPTKAASLRCHSRFATARPESNRPGANRPLCVAVTVSANRPLCVAVASFRLLPACHTRSWLPRTLTEMLRRAKTVRSISQPSFLSQYPTEGYGKKYKRAQRRVLKPTPPSPACPTPLNSHWRWIRASLSMLHVMSG